MLNNVENYRLQKEIERAWYERFAYYTMEGIPHPPKLMVKLLPEEAMSEFYAHKHHTGVAHKETGRFVRPIPNELVQATVRTPMRTVRVGVDKHSRVGVCECGQIFFCEEV